MNNSLKHELELFAVKERMLILEGIYNAKAGHPGGSLSIAELMAYLYNVEMNVDPTNPKWEDRDRFVLSKGHAAPALYATLALKGFFPTEDIKTLRKADSYLQGHPSMKCVPGVDMSTGSLGQGISTAVGMALAAKYDNKLLYLYYHTLQQVPYQLRLVWHLLQSMIIKIQEFIQFLVTVKSKKVRFGKQQCLQVQRNLTTW